MWNAIDRHNVRQVDFGRSGARKFDFGLLGSLFQTLKRHWVFAQVNTAVLVFELLNQPLNDTMVEVVTAKVSIAVGRFYLEYAVAKFKHRYIVGTATAVEHNNLHILVGLVQAVGKGSRSRLVHNTANVQACNLASLFSSLTLRVVEVCRNGNHGVCNFLIQIVFGCFLHFLKNDGRNFLRSVETSVDVDTRGVVVAAHNLVRHARNLVRKVVVAFAHKPLD